MRPRKYVDCVGVKVYIERARHSVIMELACGNVSEWIRRAIEAKLHKDYVEPVLMPLDKEGKIIQRPSDHKRCSSATCPWCR